MTNAMTATAHEVWAVLRWAHRGGDPAVSIARLREVVSRAARVAPSERTVAVVLEQDMPWWRRTLGHLPRGHVIAQPFDRGSGTAVLLAALAVARRAPEAEVEVLYPDDPSGDLHLGIEELLELFRRWAPESAITCEAAARAVGPIERLDALELVFPQLSAMSFTELRRRAGG